MGQSENTAPTRLEQATAPASNVNATLAAIDAAPDLPTLEAMAPSLTKLDNGLKVEARERYRARKHALMQQQVSP
jgi:hypothetical protein